MLKQSSRTRVRSRAVSLLSSLSLISALLAQGFAAPAAVSAAPVPPAVTVATSTTISVGGSHTCAIESEDLSAAGGKLRCWGSDASYQIQNGHSDSREPILEATASDWVTVAAGGSHTCAIRSTDQLACWGKNSKGQLGVGSITPTETLSYLTVAGGAGWSTVSAGLEHTCAIRSDRTLWCWGKNSSSQLGIGSTALKNVPTKVGTGANWAIVSAGAEHTCAVQFDGSLWCWGLGSNGRLGLSASSTSGVKVPTRVGTENTWKSVAAGAAHTCAVKTAGTLWCWGAGGSGRLGRSSTADSKIPVQVGTLATWSSVSTGLAHTCATSTAGALSCWGANTKGEVPGSSSLSVTTPYAVTAPTTTGAVWSAVSTGDRETCATPTLGPIVCWGLRSDTATLPQRVGAVGGWSSVDAGNRHTCAINADNALYCWGTNLNGQLGDGSKISRILPSREATSGSDWESVSAGENSTCAIRADGSLYCFGLNSLGQLGTGTTTSSSRPVQESSGRPDWTKVSVGTTHACAVNQDHELFCWGDSAYDQIPGGYSGELDPTLNDEWNGVVDVSSSATETCLLDILGHSACWGEHNGGSVVAEYFNADQVAAGTYDGLNDWCVVTASVTDCENYLDATDSTFVAVGGNNVCHISTGGVLRCAGSNVYGQLGFASYVNDYSGWKTVLDPSLSYLDDPATTDIDESDEEAFGQWVSVSLGDTHACAINLDGTLYCWGSNANGRLGVGSPAEAFAPVVENKWAQPAELDGGPSSATVVTTSVALSPEMSLGYEFACSMTNALDIWCVGSNTYGQLGQSNTDDSLTAVKVPLPTGVSAWLGVSAADNFVCAIGRLSASATVGGLYCWGYNGYGQLGLDDTTNRDEPTRVGTASTWAHVAVGADSTCAITSAGVASCWGRNHHGQLGDGTGDGTDDFNRDQPTLVSTSLTFKSISISETHACAVDQASSSIYCWGWDGNGQLGNGAAGADSNVPLKITSAVRGWATVSTFGYTTCAVSLDGALYCWGYGVNGRLGSGLTDEVQTPVRERLRRNDWASVETGYDHTCARTTAGVLYCWGLDTSGELGIGGASTMDANNAIPRVVEQPTTGTWRSFDVGYQKTCALTTTGAMYCWGKDPWGGNWSQPDRLTLTGLALPASGTWATVSSSSSEAHYNCATTSTGALYCWGDNGSDRLGIGRSSAAPAQLRSPASGQWASVKLGDVHTCAITTLGALYCWGSDQYGKMGTGADSVTPLKLTAPASGVWTTVSLGNYHTCATTSLGALYCWGYGGDGQLGLDDDSGRSAPTLVAAPATGTWVTVTAGERHTCATTSLGALYCWGLNVSGQLGLNDTTVRDQPAMLSAPATGTWATVDAGDGSTCATTSLGALYCWGVNNTGQLGLDDATDRDQPAMLPAPAAGTWATVQASWNHTCATTSLGALYCWGYNGEGRFGLNDTTDRDQPAILPAPATGTWAKVSTGKGTCAVSSIGSLFCAGEGAIAGRQEGDLKLAGAVASPWGRLLPAAVTMVSAPFILSTPSPKIGVTLTADRGVWTGSPEPTSGSSFAFQWYRCTSSAQNSGSVPTGCNAISSATNAVYTPKVGTGGRGGVSDVGFYLRVRVTVSNGVGSAAVWVSAQSAVVAP